MLEVNTRPLCVALSLSKATCLNILLPVKEGRHSASQEMHVQA
jgi:hypothetical protein